MRDTSKPTFHAGDIVQGMRDWRDHEDTRHAAAFELLLATWLHSTLGLREAVKQLAQAIGKR